MFMGNQKTPTSVLDRKVKKNPRYAKVRGSLDTGPSVSKVKTISTKEFLRRQKEAFGRVAPDELQALIEEESGQGPASPDHRTAQSVREEKEEKGPFFCEKKALERQQQEQAQHRANNERESLLILDLRPLNEFQQCHISGAVSYPMVNINQDRYTAIMYRFKNKQGKSLVVYSDDERLAREGATLLVERGFENACMLTGGLRFFAHKCPSSVVGQLPQHLVIKAESPTLTPAKRREERRRRLLEEQKEGYSPRMGYAASLSGASSVCSTISHRSTFSRAPRWNDGRASAQDHRERVAKLHHTIG